ncbi:MAG TPA: endonuclease/exonuclease/phosphatase family protein [Chitinophagaceae bacterium]|nr:endonuclease/exonuclease/phosphatase family protein [Chitinophagaceae bacterium]
MKIITWNCNMAFRRKADFILQYRPDILVVPECEHPDRLKFPAHIQQPTDMLWFGKNKNKGLGIFSYSKYKLSTPIRHNKKLRTIVPISVTHGRSTLTLFAIWANNPDDPDGQYVEQVWKALHHYDHLLTHKRTVLVGDFNSNTIWDRKYREGNHSTVVKRLEEKGIYSSYHLHHKQTQGKEKHPTLYMYRHKDKPYHIDYCFVSKDLASKINSVEVGACEFWTRLSDHVPLIVSFL